MSFDDPELLENLRALLQRVRFEEDALCFSSDVLFDGGVRVLGDTVKLQERKKVEASSVLLLGSEEERVPYGGVSVQTPQGSKKLVWVAEKDAWCVYDQGELRPLIQTFVFTQTHNFWIANEVVETTDASKEILPEFVSVSDHENKWISAAQARVSSGTAQIAITKDNDFTGHEVQALPEAPKVRFEVPVQDGNSLGIEVLESNKARNLSVSLTVTTEVFSSIR